MIVPMKKVSVVVLDTFREESLEKLRKVGALHLESTDATSATLTDLQEKRSLLGQAIRLLPEKAGDSPYSTSSARPRSVNWDSPLEIAEKIIELSEKQLLAVEETSRLEREADRLSQWGDFDPADIRALREKGIDIRLFRLTKQQMKEIPEGPRVFVLNETKSTADLAVVSTGGPVDLPFEEMPLPELGLSGVRKVIKEKNAETEEIQRELVELSAARPQLEAAVGELDSGIEFEGARAGMGLEEKLAFLTGYAPVRTIDDLKKAAVENGWGLLVEDPGEEDPVPTLIENHKWIKIIQPVFKIMDTVPGYKEYDISVWFLLFFSIFFALLIGDAGYGVLFLLLTFTTRRFLRKAPPEPFTLMYILSICTIAWGAVTGNWFGYEELARLPGLNKLIIPSLYAYSSKSEFGVKYICFILAAIQLSLGHIIVAFKYMNSLKALAQIGWALVVWGLFFLVRQLMLEIPTPPFWLHMIAAGLVLVLFFTSSSRNIFKRLGLGLAEVPMNTIDVFKDTLSYIRLFAVGMATLAVAQSFNALGASVGFSKIYLIPVSVLIIAGGHLLNIVLAMMSVAVHGLRLNMLEFSGHIGMEWSGQKYRPFCNKKGA